MRLTNTLGGKTEEFTPVEAGHVRMYSCGPTVYGPAHVGNFRAFLLGDLTRRYLRVERLQGHLGDEHHRRRRSDHPRPDGGGRDAGRADRAAYRPIHWPT